MDKLRKIILKASYEAGACHLASSLSTIDILVEIFKKKKNNDLFIFSKASGFCAYLVILAEQGIIPYNKISYYLKKYPLVSHEVPGVIWSGGSLGMGLSVACGLALADRNRNIYCLISDGECQEGNVYEAALFARQHKLINLFVYIDANSIQACDFTDNVLNLDTAFEFLKNTLPNVEVKYTIKGKGVSFMQNKVEWHYKNLDDKLLKQALKE